jgi:hypothetical protein
MLSHLFYKVSSLLGLGFEKLILGKIVLFSRDKTAFMTLVIPDAPSECPTLGLTFIITISGISRGAR